MSPYNRRLPVYLLLDCSESMVGDAFSALNSNLSKMISDLKQDPHNLETVAISIITFSVNARQVIPLTDLYSFQIPKLTLGSGTALGAALKLLEQCIDREIVKTSAERKGDYKPICFILTDGEPTDKWENIADQFKQQISKKRSEVIAVAFGPDIDTNKLHRISDTVFVVKNADTTTFSEFFKLVSASISTASQKIETVGYRAIDPSSIPNEVVISTLEDRRDFPIMDRFIFLHTRCSRDKKFYITKYEKKHIQGGMHAFQGIGSYALDSFDIGTEHIASPLKVSTELLFDSKPCPYCGNKLYAICKCGGIHCCPESKKEVTLSLTCPWCNQTDTYGFSSGGLDISRGAG